jgi:hypothetical protein
VQGAAVAPTLGAKRVRVFGFVKSKCPLSGPLSLPFELNFELNLFVKFPD